MTDDDKLVEAALALVRKHYPEMRPTYRGRRFQIAYEALKQHAPDALLREALEPVIHWYQSDEHPERPLHEIVADVVADLQADRAALLNPPKHRFWGAGEPGCPPEVKAGNGEIHTLLCKVCGQRSPRDSICRAQLKEPTHD